jgi:hypothetical protein
MTSAGARSPSAPPGGGRCAAALARDRGIALGAWVGGLRFWRGRAIGELSWVSSGGGCPGYTAAGRALTRCYGHPPNGQRSRRIFKSRELTSARNPLPPSSICPDLLMFEPLSWVRGAHSLKTTRLKCPFILNNPRAERTLIKSSAHHLTPFYKI